MGNNEHDNRTTIDCPTCKQRFGVKIPTGARFNDLGVSALIATHEKPITCIGCGQYLIWAIADARIAWVTMPITREQAQTLEGSSIIIPSPNLKVM